MNSAIPIQGTLRVWHHESSPLRSPRDSDNTPRQWQRAKVVEGQQAATALALQQLQRDVNRLRLVRPAADNPTTHPFQLYQGSTWLKWKCRTGYVIETGAPWIPTLVDTEFTLTTGVAKSYFWLDVDSQTINVSNLITWTAKKIPLGWVDTLTKESDSIATAINVVNTHIITLCP